MGLLLAVACRSSAERVFEVVGSAPAFVGLVETPACAISVNDLGAAVCIDAAGQTPWRAEVCHPVRHRPTIIGGTLWVACENGEWHGVDVKSGKPRWKQPGRRVPISGLASDGLRGFVAGDGGVVEVIDETGATQWSVRGGPRLAAGGDVLAVASLDGGLAVFDATHGGALWADEKAVVALAGTDGVVLAARAAGDVVAWDTKTGAPRWGVTLGAIVPDSLSVEGERIWVGLASREVVELSAVGGAEKGRFRLTGLLAAPVHAGVASVSGRDGCAVVLATGQNVCADHALRGSAVLLDGVLLLGPRDGRVLGFRPRRSP
ncbi:MAG: PQQ-binding-like beta-propeller repeat protein [Myxococcaceae bacterium]|nr:PQQ-binding-like beta-propeller repeat protein [Myxococcaceae bacterium]